jgi:hypothetical protein
VAECGANGMCVPEGTVDVVVEGPEVVSPVVEILDSVEVAAEVGAEEVLTADGVATNCPPGTHPVWGNCVKDEDESGPSGGGCTMDGAPVDSTAVTLILLALVLLYASRRQWGGTS